MYETFFGLNRRPFVPAPDPSYYFPAETIESARRNLLRCLQRGEGPGLVVGPSGIGKTLLCRVLAEQLRSTSPVVLLCSGRLSTRNALFQTILHGLGRPYRGMNEGESRLALIDCLNAAEDRPASLVLLVDEAQTLPTRLLDEIRMLTNLAEAGQSRVRVVLAGNPALEERFASPKLESFSQRLVARCYLEPFQRGETEQYIRAQIEAAGGDAVRLFSTEGAAAVHRATDGVPRLVNQLCDHALVLAYADGNSRIDASRVEEAWADLQQLPTPWTEPATSDMPDTIEFGGLDDDDIPTRDDRAPEEITAEDSDDLSLFSSDEEPEVRFERIEQTLGQLEPSGESFEQIDLFQPSPAADTETISASSEASEPSHMQPPTKTSLEEERDDLGEKDLGEFEELIDVPRRSGKTNSKPASPRIAPVSIASETVESTLAEPFAEEVVVADTRAAAASPLTTKIVAETCEHAVPFSVERRIANGPDKSVPTPAAPEVIIVEDESESEPEPAIAAARLVAPRRDEYRRLFAKLRQK